MNPFDPNHPLSRPLGLTRRQFFGQAANGLGSVALASLVPDILMGSDKQVPGALSQLHHTPKAKRVIYLFQAGGPAQQELFDYKPGLKYHFDQDLPDSIRQGQRLTGMTSKQ